MCNSTIYIPFLFLIYINTDPNCVKFASYNLRVSYHPVPGQ
jgi:hypothetical protein